VVQGHTAVELVSGGYVAENGADGNESACDGRGLRLGYSGE